MHAYFVPLGRSHRRIILSHCLNNGRDYCEDDALSSSLPTLLRNCGLLPNPDELRRGEDLEPSSRSIGQPDLLDTPFGLHIGLLESHLIEPARLNAYRLSALAGVHILWTENISRHLLLSKHGKTVYLELFALPCALRDGARAVLSRSGLDPALMDEITASYAALFNPVRPSIFHRWCADILGLRYFCWCLACISWRLRKTATQALRQSTNSVRSHQASSNGIYDSTLYGLMDQDPAPWDQTEFRNLWPRIVTLDDHLAKATPVSTRPSEGPYLVPSVGR
jgi:hypothetical protein